MALTDKLSAIGQAIRDMTGKSEMLTLDAMPGEIRSIEGGGGSSADVRYVTFMSYDGTEEYIRLPVAVGYDCPKPKIETPKRESDVQYNYTFAGWATTVNGALDSNALKSVTEDRTVYANYASVLRSYTITYYDGDTVLKTETLTYGSTPSYTASKAGYNFDGWEPEIAAVTGDASYYAQWSEKLTFAGASWDDISRVSEAGEAQNHFAVGDSRTIQVTIDGTAYPFVAKIVGFDHDTKTAGGTAGITCMFFTVPAKKYTHGNLVNNIYGNKYAEANYAKAAASFYENLPSELQAVLKPVDKQYNEKGGTTNILTASWKTWIPSFEEISKATNSDFTSVIGSLYAYFSAANQHYGSQYYAITNKNSRAVQDTAGASQKRFWTRNMPDKSKGAGNFYAGTSGNGYIYRATYQNATDEYSLAIGFCI